MLHCAALFLKGKFKNNPAVRGKNLYLDNRYKISFELDLSEANEFEADGDKGISFGENDVVELVEV